MTEGNELLEGNTADVQVCHKTHGNDSHDETAYVYIYCIN